MCAQSVEHITALDTHIGNAVYLSRVPVLIKVNYIAIEIVYLIDKIYRFGSYSRAPNEWRTRQKMKKKTSTYSKLHQYRH